MLEKVEFHVEGVTQQLWHNGQLADQTNAYAVAMKAITSKKKKTEEDFRRLEDLEWEGSLYLNAEKRPVVPGEVIAGAFWEAAKTKRRGGDVRNGLISQGDWPILHNGPGDLDRLRADPRFRKRCTVKNPSTGSRLTRVRPLFDPWSLRFVVKFDPELLSRADVVEFCEILGSKVGLSDDRKMMGGRFKILKVV